MKKLTLIGSYLVLLGALTTGVLLFSPSSNSTKSTTVVKEVTVVSRKKQPQVDVTKLSMKKLQLDLTNTIFLNVPVSGESVDAVIAMLESNINNTIYLRKSTALEEVSLMVED